MQPWWRFADFAAIIPPGRVAGSSAGADGSVDPVCSCGNGSLSCLQEEQCRHEDALARVIDEVITPGAGEVDAAGVFPHRQIEALAGAGLLGLTVPAEFSGGGQGLRAAAQVVRELGAVCGSTAMVVTMHYAATAALIAGGMKDALTEIAAGQHLSTLAFSEFGSRSHFWAPLGTATAAGSTCGWTPARAGSPQRERPIATSGRAGRCKRPAR